MKVETLHNEQVRRHRARRHSAIHHGNIRDNPLKLNKAKRLVVGRTSDSLPDTATNLQGCRMMATD